jgi:hypothetical protein
MAPGCSARHDERVDVESLGLTVELWQRVLADLAS